MTLRRTPFALVALLALPLAACGFHLRREAELPPSMKRVHIQIADSSSALAKGLAKALPRSGSEVVEMDGPDIATLRFDANAFSTDVLSVGGNARATEYSLRYHVEFEVLDGTGGVIVPRQTIELSRDFTFDASQSLGVAAQTDLLTKELQQDMVQAVLRRLEARTHAAQ
ncbi:MAG: LPS-assembly lipoprotein LptE [Dokdonella sp.]|uniref:LPS-assembly lipoprotein LptE n=1 Tax=Dokdonella sp. TaxID=2291710 RepID=UPI003F7F24E4